MARHKDKKRDRAEVARRWEGVHFDQRRDRKRPRAEEPQEHEAPRPLERCRHCKQYTNTLDVKQVPDPSGGVPYWAVECPGCEARGPVAINKALAVKLWNEGITHEYPRRLRRGEWHLKHGNGTNLPPG